MVHLVVVCPVRAGRVGRNVGLLHRNSRKLDVRGETDFDMARLFECLQKDLKNTENRHILMRRRK